MNTKLRFGLALAFFASACGSDDGDSVVPDGGSPDMDVDGGGTTRDTTAPTFAGLGSAVAVSESQVDLSWTEADDDRTPTPLILYRIYMATTPGGQNFGAQPRKVVVGVDSTSITGLEPLQDYYFVVHATDEAGNTNESTVEVQAIPPDLTAPSFAGVQSAVPSGPGAITLGWDAATDSAESSESLQYNVYVADTFDGHDFGAASLTTPAGASDAMVSGLPGGQERFFVVRAVDPSGNEESNTIALAATTIDSQAPTFAGATTATPGPSSVTVNWTTAIDDVTPGAAMRYLVYQAAATGTQDFGTPTAMTAPGATEHSLGGLAADTTYYYVVRAMDAAGNVDDNTEEVSATTPSGSDVVAPTFAGAESATAQSPKSIRVDWPAAGDDVSLPGQISYLVYQADASGTQDFGTPSFTTVPGATSFLVEGLEPSTLAYFVVRARDRAGNVDGNTEEVSATTLPDSTAPTFTGLTSAMPLSPTSILLGWAPATDDVTPSSEIEFLVYQADASGGQDFGTPIDVTSPGAASYTATGLSAGVGYYFVVRARDAAGNEETNTVEETAETFTTVSLAADVQPIFDENCTTGCHGSGQPPEGLDLSDAATSHANMVDVLSVQCLETLLVEPWSPDTSYLVHKLDGDGPCFLGDLMPRARPPLSGAEIARVRTWIAEGARNN